MNDGGAWRLLAPVVRDAAVLLGQFQAVLEAVGAGQAPPTVCCERWASSALILGAGQSAADANLPGCRARGVAVVRRLAGGTAVYATPDYLSFAVVAPAAHPLVSGALMATYRRLGEAVVAACAALGLSTRLIAPYEVLVGNRKLVGVAQVRRFGAVAYVGGLYRTLIPAEQGICLAGDAALRAERAAQLAACTIDLATLGRPGALDQFPTALVAALGGCQGIIPTPGEFTDAERARAARLTAERYARDEWTLRT